MKKILSIIFAFAQVLIVLAQPQDSIPPPENSALINSASYPYVVPRTISDETLLPSPEAAQMNRYVDYPVSRNTGTADVSILLYDLSLKDIPFSISMSYHTSGCKVDDVPGSLGLGWTLHAGGCISRVIHGQPDESLPFAQKTRQEITSRSDLDYLKDIVHLQKEGNYDRYYYSFEGYSGSFICTTGGVVTQLPATNLKIETKNKTADGVYDFVITTPEGICYHFTEREHVQYQFSPSILDELYHNPNYNTVSCWHLSKVVSTFSKDSISLSYVTIPSWQRSEEVRNASVYFETRSTGGSTQGSSVNDVNSKHFTTFPDQRVLSRITCRTGTINFTSSGISGTRKNGTPNIRMSKIDVKNALGKTVRTIGFDNNLLFGDKRLCLGGVSITSDGKLLDKRTFDYYDRSYVIQDQKKDFFGYSNSRLSGSSLYSSILNTSGELSDARRYHFESARTYALKSIQEATGGQTSYTYEANRCNLFRTPVNIGLRISSISVTDPVARKNRQHTFTYEREACTVNFNDISTTAFISLSGVRSMTIGSGGIAVSSGSVFTGSCRIPGFRAESAIIYYGKVTEVISGTGVEQPIKTEYEYDTSNCAHPFIGAGLTSIPSLDINGDPRYLGTKIYYPTTSPGSVQTQNRIFGPQFVGGYFQETCWEKAPLVRRKVYRHTGSGYEPVEEEINRYSLEPGGSIQTGTYVESIVRTTNGNGISREDFKTTDDFNFFEVTAARGRLFKDTTIIIRHYPNSVSHREVTSYTYNKSGWFLNSFDPIPLPLPSLPGFSEDSLEMADNRLLQSVKTVCGNQTFERYYCYSSNVRRPFYTNISSRWNINLPIMEKWVINTKDTILLHWQYQHFGQQNLRPRRKTLSWNRSEIAVQAFNSYDDIGNLLQTSINELSPVTYAWDRNWNYPVSVLQGGLTTRYAYEPLIGCTLATSPNGEEVNYQYLGGRLSRMTDHSKKTVAEYSYTLRGEGVAENAITTRSYLYGTKNFLEQTQYYDGLGLPVQLLEKEVTPTQKHLLHVLEYDGLGRETRNWLPIPTTSEGLISNYSNLSATHYADSYAYEDSRYEAAQNGRLTSKAPPGSEFRSHPVSYEYLASNPQVATLRCNRYEAVNAEQFRCTGTYQAGELEVVATTDEDGHKQYTFVDFRGNTVLVRQVNDGDFYDTYFVHDAFGDPLLVLPPMASAALGSTGTWSIRSNDVLQKYAYYYRYDSRHQCVEKKLPGALPNYYVFDKTGRLIFSQDGNQRAAGEWTFYLYDELQRLTVQGVCKNTNTASVSSVIVNCERRNSNTGLDGSGYTSSFSLTSPEVHIVNYYDDYGFKTLTGFSSSKFAAAFAAANQGYVKGYPAGSVTKVLGSNAKIHTALFYDIKGQVIQSIATNHLDGYETVNTTYTFSGKPKTVNHIHTTNESSAAKTTIDETYTYNYDHAERVISVNYKLGNNTVTLTTNQYDELGRLKNKLHHGSSANTLAYEYNIRSWLTGIVSPKFTQQLHYTSGMGTPYYNGNISSMTWKIDNGTTRGYKFTYDGLNRMLNAVYGEGDNLSSGIGRFSENVTEYDRNGNIKSLQRSGRTSASAYGLVDNLTLQYSGNQLINVSDAASDPLYSGAFNFVDGNKGTVTEYIYDSNGNLQQDFNKNIANIQHNMLNLPSVLQFSNGNRKDYQYSADGIKRRVTHQTAIANISVPMGQLKDLSSGQVSQTYTVDYCGNVIYENGSLSKILTEEGYVTFSGGTPTYHYYLKDHQGNNRMVVRPNGASWITEQENHYYPFGGVFEVNTANSGIQAYKYSGKEFERMHGLDWYDYGARHYDAALGRFTRMDRFAEKYYPMSSYQYGANNPVGNLEHNGDSIVVLSLTDSQHLGMLIQNDSKKWQYYSFNGDKIYNSTDGVLGGRPNDDIAVGEWKSPQDFIDSDYNKGIVEKGDKANLEINAYGYQEGYVIPTSTKQDEIIRNTFVKEVNKGYSLINNHCSMAVQKSLYAAGIETRNSTIKVVNRQMGDAYNVRVNAYFPSMAYEALKKNNPHGFIIRRNR